jgi:hypothetical protein
MLDVTFTDKVEDELSAAFYLEMLVLQRRDPLFSIVMSALLCAVADV